MHQPEPDCAFGHSEAQLRELFGDAYEQFQTWIRHKTVTICEGESLCAQPHGRVAFERDVWRYIRFVA